MVERDLRRFLERYAIEPPLGEVVEQDDEDRRAKLRLLDPVGELGVDGGECELREQQVEPVPEEPVALTANPFVVLDEALCPLGKRMVLDLLDKVPVCLQLVNIRRRRSLDVKGVQRAYG